MDSPIHIGDLTTNSIQHKLDSTHLTPTIKSFTTALNSTIISSIKLIQLSINLLVDSGEIELIIFRRVQDSFININQLLDILIQLKYFTKEQVENFLNNEILGNIEYFDEMNSQILDWRNNKDVNLRGFWVSYDKAVNLCLKFDIYELVKSLFLIDVHEFENLPRVNKRQHDEQIIKEDVLQSPSKKQKLGKELINNPNYPNTLPPIDATNTETVNDLKVKLGEIFKQDDQQELTSEQIKSILEPIISKGEVIMDIPLDNKGQTSLHFAATLASVNLVGTFIELGINSPIRGNNLGESALVSAIQVTNSMEKGNFHELLNNWLYPNVVLFDNRKYSILHHLIVESDRKFESCKFYTKKIIEFIIQNDKYLFEFVHTIVNSQDLQGNTPLHLSVELENKWFIKLLLELGADVNIPNKMGIIPGDFEIVKETIKEEFEEQIFQLIKTSIEFLNKRLEVSTIPEQQPKKEINSSNKIFSSIQQLLNNTNQEYESILNSKREQINQLEKSLHDSTIVTANNRYITKKIKNKLIELDNLKLQIANITDKLNIVKQEVDIEEEYNPEEPFLIKPLYERMVNNESVDDIKQEVLEQLESPPIIKARINAYKQVNESLEQELKGLIDYNELTCKFKKVVSICTGVDINEVDELLDGLLQAVEGQQ